MLLAGCGAETSDRSGTSGATASFEPITVPPPATVADGVVAPETTAAVEAIVASPLSPPPGTLDAVTSAGDVRFAWLLTDLLRLGQAGEVEDELVRALTSLVGAPPPDGQDPWVAYTDVLVRWDVAPPDGYARWKRDLLLAYEPAWQPILEGVGTEGLDWRAVAPSGVALGEVAVLGEPAMVSGERGRWLPDADRVVGVTVGDEHRAYPLRVLAAHEVVEDGADAARIAVVHDAVSGTLAVYDTTERGPRLGVSGLMSHGVDLLYDVASGSLVDPLSGAGLTGTWWAGAVSLDRVPFALTTWGEWRQAHPDSLIVAEDGGLGRVYLKEPYSDVPAPPRALGDVDPRLGAAARVLAAETPDGGAVAFPLELVELSLVRGERVGIGDVTVALDAGALVASAGEERVAAVVTSWADWSRLHPDSALWEGDA